MRGAGDELTVGQRIAFYRRRRGLTQATFGALVGRSEEWVSSVERGRRQVRRLDVLAEIARALRVSLPDLVGQPVLMEAADRGDDIDAVRAVLMAPSRLSRVMYRAVPEDVSLDVAANARFTESVWFEYQAGRLGRVVETLPGLIAVAQRLERQAKPGGRGWEVSARVHHLASTTATRMGEIDLAWIASERAIHAAEQSGNPLAIASAARSATHALLANGRYEEAMDLGRTSAEWLRTRMREDDPAALSLYGMLNLRTAVAAARNRDRKATADFLGLASRAAERVGTDTNHWQTGFGPTNVLIHRLSTALDLGDYVYVAECGRRVDVSGLPVERQTAHRIDTGLALTHLARDDEALDVLLEAERIAPEIVRHHAAVREVVKTMHRRAPVISASTSSPLMGLASRVRAV